jgi:hypothetical protein
LTTPAPRNLIDGTSGGASDGMVDITYDPATGQLKILKTGGNLHAYNVSGCFGLYVNGNAMTLSGTYTVTPKQNISSP